MKKKQVSIAERSATKRGYNEKNPGESQGAFAPASNQKPYTGKVKSNVADKKRKEDTATQGTTTNK